VLTLRGEEHINRRRLEQALFSRDALERYELELLVPVIVDCMRTLERGADGIVRADLVRLVRRMLLRISAAIVGLDEVADAADSRLEAALDGINVGVQSQWATEGREAQLDVGMRAKEDLVTHYLSHARRVRADMLDRIADGTLDEADAPRDLLMLLLQRQREDPDLTDDTIVRECILYLVASVDTSVNAVTHVLTELESWLEQQPADRQRLADPEFLRLATEETLRLHPPSPATIREAAADLTVGEDLRFEQGEEAMCDFASSNTDASIFGTAPERFDPHREIADRVPRYGHSFGTGHHVCLGRSLALGDRKLGTTGSVVRILSALYDAGVERDPDAHSQRAASLSDRYDAYPVRFSRL
jgi:benzoate 4-monooxygenase